MTDTINDDFLKSKLSVFVSSTNDTVQVKNKIGNFEVVASMEDIGQSKKEKIVFLFSGDENPAPISKAVKNTLAFLDQKNKPFFLMVEGAKIDSYSHSNNIGGVIDASIAFDQVSAEALKFADITENTLIIITTNHETGGLPLPQGNLKTSEIEGDFTTDDHTGIMVLVFSYGPKSDIFRGVYENNVLFIKMVNALNVK
ncbi:MAG: alkaline phosphatase [Maribacter sp.]|jgi:alkaline phosphatase